jgi:hypothetical protein
MYHKQVDTIFRKNGSSFIFDLNNLIIIFIDQTIFFYYFYNIESHL